MEWEIAEFDPLSNPELFAAEPVEVTEGIKIKNFHCFFFFQDSKKKKKKEKGTKVIEIFLLFFYSFIVGGQIPIFFFFFSELTMYSNSFLFNFPAFPGDFFPVSDIKFYFSHNVFLLMYFFFLLTVLADKKKVLVVCCFFFVFLFYTFLLKIIQFGHQKVKKKMYMGVVHAGFGHLCDIPAVRRAYARVT